MKTEIVKHTATPWTVWDTHPDYYNIGPMSDPIVAAWKFPHNAIANATFIVRACNAYDGLIDDLKDALDGVETGIDRLDLAKFLKEAISRAEAKS